MYILCLCLLLEYDIRLKRLFRKKEENHENSLLLNIKLQEQKSKEFTFGKHYVSKKEIQFYAMIRMGGGVVLPMQKSEGVLSEGVLSEGVLS